jgi:four helix bundle protein
VEENKSGVVTFAEWLKTVPAQITGDTLWKVEAYRLALFAVETGWQDVCRLAQDRRTVALSDQLYRTLGSIGANLAEGYSRGTGRDRGHFYEYALGSAREARHWYQAAAHALDSEVVLRRLNLMTALIRLLLTMIPQQRNSPIREPGAAYTVDAVPEDF